MDIINRAIRFLSSRILRRSGRSNLYDATNQLMLKFAYKEMFESGRTLPLPTEVGFKTFSQSDEDGILLYIFSLIGVVNQKSVEICAGDGIECNTANLIINHGWQGLLVDGNKDLVDQGKQFYRSHPNTYVFPPTFVQAWITRLNVNHIIEENDFGGEIDLLSLDLDGMDYWIWDAITSCNPRVVVVEYQDILGPELSVTVPYEDKFDARQYPMSNGVPNYCGASLAAFVKLARRRGYRLIATNRYGFNAFFVRNPIGELEFKEIPVKECFTHPKVKAGIAKRYPLIKDYPWVEV